MNCILYTNKNILSIDRKRKMKRMSKIGHQKQVKLVKLHKNFVKIAWEINITE